MPEGSQFTIDASTVKLGAVLARGSPGVTLYVADLQMGERSMKVSELLCMQHMFWHTHVAHSWAEWQVAVKRLQTCGAPKAAEAVFLKEMQTLRLASAMCHRACRLIGCCKLDGDACIVMPLYPKSAAKHLEEATGLSGP